MNRLLSVLVVGSGGREHALVWGLRRSPSVGALFAMPGNPGIAELADCLPIHASDVAAIVDWTVAQKIDLVVVGPEAPLANGLSDRLLERGVPVFGPTRAAAELEWSKAFSKSFLREHGIPTADFLVFADADAALEHTRQADYPLVIKVDGLAAGKGVTVCETPAEATLAIRAALVDGVFGAAGARLVIEEFLVGEEVSLIALVDGERFACLPPARDYKRLGDGDVGPNTGGMGSYAPTAAVDPLLLEIIEATILRPTVDGMRNLGRPFRGALFVGLMLTAAGPRVLEFNCRFGDPETQAILPLLDGDLARALLGCAAGELDPAGIRQLPGAAVSLTLAAAGYPARPELGQPISGLAEAAATGALIFHAGTAEHNGQIVSVGGRVLSVVGQGSTLTQAVERAYAAADLVSFPGRQLRRDIGSGVLVHR